MTIKKTLCSSAYSAVQKYEQQSNLVSLHDSLQRRCALHWHHHQYNPQVFRTSSGQRSKFLRGKTPLKLVFQHVVDTHSQALKLELWVKKQSKTNKERIIQQGLPADTKT